MWRTGSRGKYARPHHVASVFGLLVAVRKYFARRQADRRAVHQRQVLPDTELHSGRSATCSRSAVPRMLKQLAIFIVCAAIPENAAVTAADFYGHPVLL